MSVIAVALASSEVPFGTQVFAPEPMVSPVLQTPIPSVWTQTPTGMIDDDDVDDVSDDIDVDGDVPGLPDDESGGRDVGFNDGLDEDDNLDEFDDIDEDDFDDDFDDDFEEELEDDYEIEIEDEISAEFGLSGEGMDDEEIGDDLEDFEDFDNID